MSPYTPIPMGPIAVDRPNHVSPKPLSVRTGLALWLCTLLPRQLINLGIISVGQPTSILTRRCHCRGTGRSNTCDVIGCEPDSCAPPPRLVVGTPPHTAPISGSTSPSTNIAPSAIDVVVVPYRGCFPAATLGKQSVVAIYDGCKYVHQNASFNIPSLVHCEGASCSVLQGPHVTNPIGETCGAADLDPWP